MSCQIVSDVMVHLRFEICARPSRGGGTGVQGAVLAHGQGARRCQTQNRTRTASSPQRKKSNPRKGRSTKPAAGKCHLTKRKAPPSERTAGIKNARAPA